jgi:hypothetical protein
MNRTAIRYAATATTALAVLIAAATSQASISLTLGNHPLPSGEESVSFNAGSGSTVTGVAAGSGDVVQVSSSTSQLYVHSFGDAMVEGKRGSGINEVTITVPGFTFTYLVFNPAANTTGKYTAGAPITLDVLANESGGAVDVHPTTTSPYTIISGNNPATLTATGGESISSVTIDLPKGSDFSDLGQLGIGGLNAVTSDPTGKEARLNVPSVLVPEPSSILVWSLLLLSAAAACRRRGKQG